MILIDVAAKVEFLQIREDTQLKVDFSEQELPTFWATLNDDYPLFSVRALTILDLDLSLRGWILINDGTENGGTQ